MIPANTRIELRRRVLEENDTIAERVRSTLRSRGVRSLNIAGSPGAGKTALIAAMAPHLKPHLRIAALVGDVETDHDARRLERAGIPALQIETHGACHLDAAMTHDHLERILSHRPELLIIENVGNLVCPASYDLGEDLMVALLSVTEGEDKPAKSPALFRAAHEVVLTKTDLLPHLPFDVPTFDRNLAPLRSGDRAHHTSAQTGGGVTEWVDHLLERLLQRNPLN